MKELSPKRDFINDTSAALAWAEIASNPLCIRACSVALNQFILDQGMTSQLNDAAVAQLALQGARRYISILLNLATPETVQTTEDTGVLKWHSKPPQPKRRQSQA